MMPRGLLRMFAPSAQNSRRRRTHGIDDARYNPARRHPGWRSQRSRRYLLATSSTARSSRSCGTDGIILDTHRGRGRSSVSDARVRGSRLRSTHGRSTGRTSFATRPLRSYRGILPGSQGRISGVPPRSHETSPPNCESWPRGFGYPRTGTRSAASSIGITGDEQPGRSGTSSRGHSETWIHCVSVQFGRLPRRTFLMELPAESQKSPASGRTTRRIPGRS